MHIRKLAKEIWITTQDLKKELSLVNFWVSANESEIPENIVPAIIRVLWPKFKDKKVRRLEQTWATSEEIAQAPFTSLHRPTQSGKFYFIDSERGRHRIGDSFVSQIGAGSFKDLIITLRFWYDK